ncbi:fatty acid desaturase [Alteromonas gilva]|uniref:Fatty acid desaturase n=1 Tax=Alteromonas gilva TaxID=2987522 RepID=A0ABT5L4D4_9ALTE|nr:fatty acid desaturase [Alteromonas gilva]MDC8831895.1 fatty acid desaturase [Alteromonas gilva]
MNQQLLKSREQIKVIVKAIKTEEAMLRSKYGFLAFQNTLGMLVLVLSLSSMIALGALYYFAVIPAWLTILSIAVVASISHELEHDLIHRQYFKSSPFMHNLMMLIVWIMRPNTVNPWYRRKIHLHHHQHSGTPQDLEERLVGNGVKNPIKRLLVIVDGLAGLLLFRKVYKEEIKGFSFATVFNAGFPVTTAYFVVLYSMIIYHTLNLFTPMAEHIPAAMLPVVQVFEFLMVVLILPNIVRSSSLNFVTSSMHYYGGVTNVHQQTHVITSKWFLPFQLFCFNFGKTHTIHHFFPNQPFYIRQWISKNINEVLKQQGVKFNDFESLRNANAYPV